MALARWTGRGDAGGMEPITTHVPVVLTAEAIAALPEEPLGTLEGVTHRVLWRTDESMAGVLTVAAGQRLGRHAHRRNHHHMWVLSGAAEVRLQQGERDTVFIRGDEALQNSVELRLTGNELLVQPSGGWKSM